MLKLFRKSPSSQSEWLLSNPQTANGMATNGGEDEGKEKACLVLLEVQVESCW